MTPNLVLWGFMGAGKSTVARGIDPLAVDVDAVIERRAGQTITHIFRDEGEAGFREREAEVLDELFDSDGQVIAMGGGALLDGERRRRWQERHVVVRLRASLAEVRARVGEGDARPLFDARDLEHRMAMRAAAYDDVWLQVDTDGRTPAQVVDAVRQVADRSLHAQSEVPPLMVSSPGGTYPVWFGDGLLEHTRRAAGFARELVVTHASLAELAERVGGPRTYLDEGEGNKRLAAVERLWAACSAHGLARDGGLIAVGGGVAGDLTGFAAATWMRGIGFVTAPTSLLAMVDASVGGKTGFDLPEGKNLVGAFHHPRAVVVDPSALETLPAAEVRAGMGEVLKHALLDDEAFLGELTQGRPPLDAARLRRSVAVKARVVMNDPHERGARAHLNLGHTFAHALERVSEYSVRHGDAVAVGLLAAAHLGRAIGVGDVVEPVQRALSSLGLEQRVKGHTADALWAAMQTDKKRARGTLRFVVLAGIGQPTLVEGVDKSAVLEAWESVGASR